MTQKSLVDQKNVRIRYRNCSKATLYRHVREGLFPQPIKISARMSGWLSDDLDKFFSDPLAWRAKHAQNNKSAS